MEILRRGNNVASRPATVDSFYQDAAETIGRYSFPQARLYLTWRLP